MRCRQNKFEVFYRLPLSREQLGNEPLYAGENVVREAVGFDTAEQVLAEVAKTVAIDPSVAVLRTTDDRVFHRAMLAIMVERNLPGWLER